MSGLLYAGLGILIAAAFYGACIAALDWMLRRDSDAPPKFDGNHGNDSERPGR